MAYDNPADRRDKRRKVNFNTTLDRIIARSASRAHKQHAAFLHALIEWAVENGAIEELVKDGNESSAA